MSKIKIWLDCDPGNDDAVAILVAAYSSLFKLVGVSTVHGNTTIDKTTYNALAVLTALGKEHEVPVYQGFDRPIIKESQTAHHIHGALGLGGVELLAAPTVKPAGESSEALFKALRDAIIENEGELCIVAIGPLTNVGQFFKANPDMAPKVKFISIMGTSASDRTWKLGEFNVRTDPESAEVIFHDPILSKKLIIIPSDLTHTAIATEKVQAQLLGDTEPPSKLRAFYYKVVMEFALNYKINKGFLDGPPVHDPVALFALLPFFDIANNLDYKFRTYKIAINCDPTDKADYGRLMITEQKQDGEEGTKIGYYLAVDEFWKLILECLALADSAL